MNENNKKMAKVNFFAKRKNLEERIQEEVRRIKELNKLLESNEEIYRLASYSRKNISEGYVNKNGLVQQMDAKLKGAEGCLQEIQEALVWAIYDLMTLNKEKMRLDLCVSKLSESEQRLLKDFADNRPMKELEEELKLSERTIKRKKQEIVKHLEQLFYSEEAVSDLLLHDRI